VTRAAALKLAWGCALFGAAVGAVGLWQQPHDFAAAWLAALSALLNWPLGSMALILVHALTGGRWGLLLRPVLLASLATLPLVALATLPYGLEAGTLYPWLHPGAAPAPNAFYLNAPFFAGRGILYLAAWFGLAALIIRALRQAHPQTALARIAPAGLIVLALTATFAAIDMTMSLDPHFASSIYGLIAMISMALTALAAGVLARANGRSIDAGTLPTLGRLLQGLVLLWGYLDFMQLLILWQSNLVHDAHWYVLRSQGSWGTMAAIVTSCHLLLPVGILLWTPARRSLTCISGAAGLLILAEVLRAWLLVLPPFRTQVHLTDIGVMLALGGLAGAMALHAAANSVLGAARRPLARV
jgi:hypothetical protein